LVGLLTVVFRTTLSVFGAHFTNSPTLPELALPEKVIVTGFNDQTALGAELAAKPTAAYAPTMMRLMERPTSRCGRYLLIGDDIAARVVDSLEFKSCPVRRRISTVSAVPGYPDTAVSRE